MGTYRFIDQDAPRDRFGNLLPQYHFETPAPPTPDTPDGPGDEDEDDEDETLRI
jgi:hypothetical protein